MPTPAANEREIRLTVRLDDEQVPESIRWDATDQNDDLPAECQAMMLALWSREAGNTYRIDLWTRDLPVEEMNAFFVQTLLSMADTYERATGRADYAGALREFGREFGRHSGASTEG